MPRRAKIAFVLLSMVAAGWFGIVDAGAQKPNDTEPVSQVLLRGIQQPKEAYLAAQLKPIRTHGTDQVRLERADIDRVQVDVVGAGRGQWIGRLMGRDRNGDGQVTAEEVRQSPELRALANREGTSPEKIQAELAKRIESEMAADADNDGIITFVELLVFANEKGAEQGSKTVASLSKLLALDPNGDGVLTAAELEAIALAAYARFDSNGNGLIDGDEITVVRDAQQPPKAKAQGTPTPSEIAACTLPPAGKEDEVVVVGTHHGDTVSNVSVVGLDGTTSVARIAVEAGSAPLYLVVTAASGVVWHVEGETARIARIVVQPRKSEVGPGAAVVGVPAERVTFLVPGTCFRYFSKPEDGEARRARAIVETALGREVAAVIAAHTFKPTAIPSGKPAPFTTAKDSSIVETPYGPRPAKGIDYETWSHLRRSFPGGIARLDVKEMIAPGPPVPYDVLPQEAGLVQLMEEGAVTRLEDGYMLILKAIPRLPAGTGRTPSSRFMLGKGVPEPAESRFTCIISEETGQLLHSSRNCR